MKRIETERLILRPFQESDYKDIYEYRNAQTVHCFLEMKLASLDEAKKEVIKLIKDKEYYFAICLEDKVIGEIFAYPESVDSNPDTYSPCWMLHPDYHQKGYAYEAAKVFFDYLFNEKGARRLYAYTEDYNVSSQKLCEKLGMRKEGFFKEFVSFTNNPDGTPLHENTIQYAILCKEWRK